MSTVIHDEVIDARAPWSCTVRTGEVLRIVDVGGNQAVDCLLYSAADPIERYCAATTIREQANTFLVAGTVLRSNEGNRMMTIVETTCEFHDTLGGACSRESNSLRYGHHTNHQHACVDNFLDAGSRHHLAKRDLVSNINWFMNVPVGDDGTLGIVIVGQNLIRLWAGSRSKILDTGFTVEGLSLGDNTFTSLDVVMVCVLWAVCVEIGT